METAKLKREELLAVVRKNRDTHRATFLRAVDGMERKWREMLEDRLAEARDGRRPVVYAIGLTEPKDQTKDYDRLIRMLEMDTRDQIELSEQQFGWYVMDDWQWKDQFTRTTSQYL